jgi:hypothetical protein
VDVSGWLRGTVATRAFPFAALPTYWMTFGVLTTGIPATVDVGTSVSAATPASDCVFPEPSGPSDMETAAPLLVCTSRSRAVVAAFPAATKVNSN